MWGAMFGASWTYDGPGGGKRAHAEHTPRARCLLAIQQHTANADATPMLSQVLMDVGRLLGLC